MLSYLLQHVFTILGFALALFLLARVFHEYERPSTSMAWFLAIVFVPYLGVPAYLLFGGRKLRRLVARKGPLYPRGEAQTGAGGPIGNTAERVLSAYGYPPARDGNRMKLLRTGEETYVELLDMIDTAQESIHVMTFILGRDSVGKEIVSRLSRKAQQGVEVRLLLDALGCLYTRGRFVESLRRAGGRVGVFMPMLPLRRRWSANLRNHRKMAIIDGEIGMIGGTNLAREYMGPAADPARWIDTNVVLRGPALADLERVFAGDWRFATGEDLQLKAGPRAPCEEDSPGMRTQVVASGPDVAGDPLYDAILSVIHEAQKRIWVVTPYFVPDEGLFKALMLQSRLGRDVRIVVPGRSNHRVADLARGRCLRRLQGMGARVFAHPTRMIHAKQIVVDDDIAISGSANLDMRSLYLNYEVDVFVYSTEKVAEMADWASGLMSQCVESSLTTPGYVRRWAEDLGWLVSPLL